MEKDSPVYQRLSEWVKSTGKKKHEVAAMLGILPQQLSQVLSGRDGLGKTMQERLEKAGADVPYILTGRKPEDTTPSNPLHYIRSLEREIEFLKEEREQYLKVLRTYNVEPNDKDYLLVAENMPEYKPTKLQKIQE